jgi:iron complex transport system substrate-binding protein
VSCGTVTIEHARGSTTIQSEPKRVVTVGLRDQEPLLALGVKAVGAMDWFQQDTFAEWPWEKRAWSGKPPQVVARVASRSTSSGSPPSVPT